MPELQNHELRALKERFDELTEDIKTCAPSERFALKHERAKLSGEIVNLSQKLNERVRF